MKTSGLEERYAEQIDGELGCFDRVVVTGTLREISHPQALAGRLWHEGIRFFDLGQFADALRQKVCEQAKTVAREAGVEIEFLAKSKGVRKEELVGAVLARRGHREPGLVHVLSVMEACTTFKPWHDKATGRTGLKTAPGRCLTFYFYLIDEDLGLMYVRVPTWLPCRLQIYFNGHHALAGRLREAGIDYQMEDNAFVHIGDWPKAQELAGSFSVERWEKKFHALAKRFCPVVATFRGGYYWTAMQVEYALDVVFKKRETLAPIYEEISRQAVLAVRVADMARFWGKHYSPRGRGAERFQNAGGGHPHQARARKAIAQDGRQGPGLAHRSHKQRASPFSVTTARWSIAMAARSIKMPR
jgi:hypothetical protein